MNRDERALEGLPLQLLIIAVVISLGLPIVYSALSSYDSNRLMKEMDGHAVMVGEKARQLYSHGEGNTDTITLTIEDGIFHQVEFLEITNATFKNQIQWSISEGYDGRHHIDGRVSLISDDTPLRLGTGEHRLRLECVSGNITESDDEMLYVEVTAL